ncbi:hypothetical protein NUM3379_18140 [Kineococcus sp. NUM-3379]
MLPHTLENFPAHSPVRSSRTTARRWLAATLAGLGLLVAAPPQALPTAGATTTEATVGAVEGELLALPSGTGAVYRDPSTSGGAARHVWSNAALTGTVALSAPARRLALRLKADLCQGAPQAVVRVDGATVGTVTPSTTQWSTFNLAGSWASGQRSVSVTYVNDFRASTTCDRNLHVDVLTFSGPVTTVTPATWSTRQVIGPSAVTDSRGRVWQPATNVTGGERRGAWGGIAGSASPQLYAYSQFGVQSWTVDVPVSARYAVDVAMADSYGPTPGARVVDVLVSDGGSAPRPLATGVDVARTVGGWWTYHVTGVVPVTSGRLVITFVPRSGQAIVSNLAVQTMDAVGTGGTVLRDDFTGAAGSPANPALWTPEVGSGPFGAGELQAYTDDRRNSALDGNGNLVITARAEKWSDRWGTRDYSSAKLTTAGKGSFTYGRVEARVKVPAGQGLWPAFWALGTNKDTVDWPLCGELDVFEHLGGQPNTVYGTIHGLGDDQDALGWRDQRVSSVGGHLNTGARVADAWHVVSMDVMPEAITFRFDGIPYYTVTPADLRSGQQWPVGSPYYLLLNLAVGGTWGGAPDASTPFPASFAVDYVSVTR